MIPSHREFYNHDFLVCGNCKYLQPKELEQTDKKEHHICTKYHKRVFHLSIHPEIVRLAECDEPIE